MKDIEGPMKGWLREHGISYRQLAANMDQSYSSIAHKVNGETAWQAKDLKCLYKQYGLALAYVLGLSSSERGIDRH